jgi:hypothetical protein
VEADEHDEVVPFEGLGGTMGCSARSFSTSRFSKTSSVELSSSVAAFKWPALHH